MTENRVEEPIVKYTQIGKAVGRREDEELLKGKALFAADIKNGETLIVGIYRSPYPHAIVKNVDLSKALQLEGISYGITGKDLQKFDFVNPMSPFPFQSRDPFHTGNPSIKFFDHFCLATDRVRFVGEPVAAVVGTNKYVVEDALDLVEADYEVLKPVVDAEKAMEKGSPLLYDEWGDNVTLTFKVSGGDVDKAFEEADVIVEDKIYSGRYTGTPLEPRAIVASFDDVSKVLTLWDSTQMPNNVSLLIQQTLSVPGLRVRVIKPNVGGGFGQKWAFYPEEVLISLLSIATGKTVKWIETRSEHMVASVHAREQVHKVKIAVKKDGKILGIKDDIIANAGAAYPVGGLASILTSAFFVPGAYKIQNYEANLRGVVTNKTPFGAHRGFGKAESAYVIEKAVNIVADKLGIDQTEIRFKNFIPEDDFPYESITGPVYDSGRYEYTLKRALELAEYDKYRKMQMNQPKDARKRLGIGVALVVEPSSSTRAGSYNAGYYSTRIKMEPDGKITLYLSGSDEGQGHATTSSQIVSELLTVPFEDILVLEGDTFLGPFGSGSYSSRFSVVGTSSVFGASNLLREKILNIAAHLMDCNLEDLYIEDGSVFVRGSQGKSMTIKQIAHISHFQIFRLPEGLEPGLEMIYHYRDPNIGFKTDSRGRVAMFSSFPYDAEVAIVEVDMDTGYVDVKNFVTVHDCGNVLNPGIVEGQHLGALVHGIGGALYEELSYDEDGQPLNTTFKDYLVPTASEVPPLVLDSTVTPNPFTPGGYKGSGETGTVGPAPVLSNAVEEALKPFGIKVRKTPLSPTYIKSLINQARRE